MIDLFSVLVSDAGLSPRDLRTIISNAPSRYKVYEIDKKAGGKREIAQPAREVKALQYIIMERVLAFLPVHKAATAYKAGSSILDNAIPHAGTGPILKMDFKEFFPSIVAKDWLLYCERSNLLNDVDRQISTALMFRRRKGEQTLRLSIGAPSSPLLSNILMLPFDETVHEAAAKRGINYTRYADDMTFSGQRIGMLKDMVKEVRVAIRRMAYPKLTVNEEKTAFVTSAVRRQVTGVTLANDGTIGIGRERKRLISARVHRAARSLLSGEDLRALAGELAFVNVVDAEFLSWLENKYGAGVIKSIKARDR